MTHETDPYHWPPDLLRALIDTIPLVCRSKADVLSFFRGAGVPNALLTPWSARLTHDRDSVRKFEIVRSVLEELNSRGDATLRARREVLKRVCEFEEYHLCWESDVLRARGLVATIRELVNRKDSFTRMREERERERAGRVQARQREQDIVDQQRRVLAKVKEDLFALFEESDAWKRGKALEGVLNRWFAAAGIAVRDAFVVRGNRDEGIVEQIDGVIELQGQLYLVEMKWHAKSIGTADIAQHLVRVFNRGGARGIFISYSGYSDAAIATCRESLGQITLALCDLEELVRVLEHQHDLQKLLRRKIEIAVSERDPYRRILCDATTGP